MRLSPIPMLVPAQAVIAIIGFGLMAFWPPASGRMLLVPVADSDSQAIARGALGAQATLLGAGPLPGSLIVVGDRAGIARRIGRSNVLIIAAPWSECRAEGAGRAA